MMLKRNKERGITLIALVVTIIVLLILAAVSLAMLTGENGILTNAKSAKENTTKGQLQEELQMAINEIQLEKTMKGETLTKKDIAEYLGSSKGAIIIDYTDKMIDGECGDYQFIVDEDNKVTIGGKLTGAKPTLQFAKSTDEEGVDQLELTVKGVTTEGEIASIESMDGLISKTTDNNSEKVYEITENKEYRFKVTGTNGRIGVDKITINSILLESESLLAGIEKITNTGENKIKVAGVTDDGNQTTEKYTVNVIYHKGDLVLGDGFATGEEINGLSYSNSKWICGLENDVNKNTVILKIDGDLTIESGKTLTAISKEKYGPKGMLVYCTGTITNNGQITMTELPSSANGQNIYVNKQSLGKYDYIGAMGAEVDLDGYDGANRLSLL